MKTTKICTLSASTSTFYKKVDAFQYESVNIKKVRIRVTDVAGKFDAIFVTGSGEELEMIYTRKDGGDRFDVVGDDKLNWNIGLKNGNIEGDRIHKVEYCAERNKFYFLENSLCENVDPSRVYLDEIVVEIEKSNMEVGHLISRDCCLRMDSDFRRFHAHYSVKEADGSEKENASIASRVLLSDEQVNYLKEAFGAIGQYCKVNGIKLYYGADECDFIAGHVDEVTYDDFNDDSDVHMSVNLLTRISAQVGYSNWEYEFVLRGAKNP